MSKIKFALSEAKREQLFIETGKPQPSTFETEVELTQDERSFLVNACNLYLFNSNSPVRSALIDGKLIDFSAHSNQTVNSIDGHLALDEFIDKLKKELAKKTSEKQKEQEAKEKEQEAKKEKEMELQQTIIANRKLIGNAALSIAFYDEVYFKAELEKQTDAETLAFIRKSIEEKNIEKAKKEQHAKEKEEFAQQQNIEAAKKFIKEKGSELAILRVKYDFSFMSLAASEAVSDIMKNAGFEINIFNNSYYKKLSVAGSDDSPSLNHLRKLDEIKKAFPENDVDLEYIDEEDEEGEEYRTWYVTIAFEIFGETKVVYLKKI